MLIWTFKIFPDENAKILQRVDPSYIFCDADVLSAAQKIVTDAGMNAKFFTVNENVDGYDSIESLLVDDGTEEDFVWVFLEIHQLIWHFNQ